MTLPDSTESPQDLRRRFPVRDAVRVRVERAHPHRARIAIRRKLRKQVEAAHVFVSADAADAFVKVPERIRASVRAERVGRREEHTAGGKTGGSGALEELAQLSVRFLGVG